MMLSSKSSIEFFSMALEKAIYTANEIYPKERNVFNRAPIENTDEILEEKTKFSNFEQQKADSIIEGLFLSAVKEGGAEVVIDGGRYIHYQKLSYIFIIFYNIFFDFRKEIGSIFNDLFLVRLFKNSLLKRANLKYNYVDNHFSEKSSDLNSENNQELILKKIINYIDSYLKKEECAQELYLTAFNYWKANNS